LERKANLFNKKALEKQLSNKSDGSKTLMFSAFYNGTFFDSIQYFIETLINSSGANQIIHQKNNTLKFLSHQKIEERANEVLNAIHYQNSATNLQEICKANNIQLSYLEKSKYDQNGIEILGYAHFEKREIIIYGHTNKARERFTIAHEIGHFILQHDKYMRSESFIESDLLDRESSEEDNLYKLEYQANYFASCLLLPKIPFHYVTDQARKKYDIRDKGFGYIYVDSQPCNYQAYNNLIGYICTYFGVSKAAAEKRLKEFNLVKDTRTRY
jgi:Zn-dependent peptidase ImmA (M78 family)